MRKFASIDIIPTHYVLTHISREWALNSYHWFFMAQPYDIPEKLLEGKEGYYIEKKLTVMGIGKGGFAPEALAEYRRCCTPENLHGVCEDYRAAATIDFEMDRVDFEAGRRIEVPTLVVWGEKSHTEKMFNPREAWPLYAAAIEKFCPLPCGHYPAEQVPDQLYEELRDSSNQPERKERTMPFTLSPRRGTYVDITDELKNGSLPSLEDQVARLEEFDLVYRTLCALLFNYVPLSGHPGGSISAGRFLAGLILNFTDYDISRPLRDDADMISFGAGHKALGLYSLWAMRNEALRIAAPELLPKDERLQMRLEDLLGFRRNPITKTPLMRRFKAKALDGHPTPATPFVRLSTGASGVGFGSSIGLAMGALDYYGTNAPVVHIIEGEGGLTPGRVSEAMAAAGTASLRNVILHVDWNQSSIDSNRVCAEGGVPGDYVQWTPAELAYLHDWNVISVPDGRDWQQIFAAQRKAIAMTNGQPTAIVYRTVKGWQYGIEGKASHGAGHKLCATVSTRHLDAFLDTAEGSLPRCEGETGAAGAGRIPAVLEQCFWESLSVVRGSLEENKALVAMIVGSLRAARDRLDRQRRKPRKDAPRVEAVYEIAAKSGSRDPAKS